MELLHFDPEKEDGNCEYKYRLTNLTNDQMTHFAVQMRYRLDQGNGEAIYEIGLRDDGYPIGLSNKQTDESLLNLKNIAESISAKICYINRRKTFDYKIPHTSAKKSGLDTKNFLVAIEKADHISKNILDNKMENKLNKEQKIDTTLDNTRFISEVLIRENNHNTKNYLDIKIAVAGNVDSSKSSTVGVLIRGTLDNGRGLARLNVFNHKHEVSTGRTSSICQQIMGFDSSGEVVNVKYKMKTPSWEEIVKNSSKIVTFFDLAGHEKYLKTTITGFSSHNPDYCMLMVGANMGITHMTREHMVICLSLKIPFFIVMSKMDISPPNISKSTYDTICKLLKLPGVRKIPFLIKSIDDAILCSQNMISDNVVPIFQISNVTGLNHDQLRVFLNFLPTRKIADLSEEKVRFNIIETFNVTGVGTVIYGLLTHGKITVGDRLLLGPDKNNNFIETSIKSIHCKRVQVDDVSAGYNACLAIRKINREDIRKGSVLLSPSLKPTPVWIFEGDITIIQSHSTTIKVGYIPIVHINNTRQSAEIVKIVRIENGNTNNDNSANSDNKFKLEALKSGDKAKITFKYTNHPEWFETGARLIFREGQMKAVGYVTQILE